MRLRDAFGIMENELAENKLTVELVDAPRPAFIGHMVRAVYSRNVKWYRELRIEYPSAYRANVEDVVSRLAGGKISNSYLVPYLTEIAKKIRKSYVNE